MRRIARRLLPAAVWMLATVSPGAANERGGAFAIRGGSTRAAVFGDAYGAVGGDADVALWNPAALVELARPHLQASYHDVFGLGLARHSSLGFAWRAVHETVEMTGDSIRVRAAPRAGTAFALGVSVLDVDLEHEAYTELAPHLAIARRLTPSTCAGFTARFLAVTSSIDGVGAQGYALDVGAAHEFLARHRVAIAIRNALAALSWDYGGDEPLPREVVLSGLASAHPRLRLLGALAWDLQASGIDRGNLAFDLDVWEDHWSLYAGHESLRSGSAMRGRAAFGTRFRVGAVAVDYAFRPEATTPGDTHHVTLTVWP
jgi:hypothetical protein